MTEGSDRVPEAIVTAAEHQRAGQLQQAERIYKRILKAQPDNADALHLLGVLSHQAGKNDVAVELIGKAIQSNPTKAFFFTNLGTVLHMQGKLEEAIASYNRALEVEPDLADAHSNLGTALRAQGKLDEATASYRRAVAVDPNLAEAHSNLGAALQAQGKLDEATASYRRAVAIDPNLAEANSNLGAALQAQGKLDEAAASYRRAIAIDPKIGKAQIRLSAILRSRGELEAARKTLIAAVRQKPLYTRSCSNQKQLRGTILQLVGIQNAYFSLTRHWETVLFSGHFSAAPLLDSRKFTVYTFYILGHNLSSYAGELPAFDLILNFIADPDTEASSLEEAYKFITQQDVPFINNPQAVFRTSRDNNYRLLNDVENLIVPKTLKGELIQNDKSSIRSILARHNLQFPLLVRPVGAHSGRGLTKIDDENDFASVKMSHAIQTFYITEFHDCRGEDGYFRKMRFIFVDGKIFPYSLLISKGWMAHPRVKDELMKHHGWMQEEERVFLEDYSEYIGQQNCKVLEDVYNRIKLDFFGIDCTLHPNGNLLLFEANANMWIYTYESHKDFPYRWKYTGKIIKAFGKMTIAKIDNG